MQLGLFLRLSFMLFPKKTEFNPYLYIRFCMNMRLHANTYIQSNVF